MQDKILNEIKKYKNIAILGFGKEGKSTYNFIRRYDKNLKLNILDAKEIELDDINATYIKYENEDILKDYDLIIKTPGISLKNSNNLNITSQMELLLEFNRENVIGITGTKGKSTTTTMLYNVLKDQLENVILVGNVGIPVLDEIEKFEGAIIVAEMSSHQLEFVKYSPHIALILNLFVDHLDHAGTIEHYHSSKMNIFRFQNKNDYALYDNDNYYLQKQNFNEIKSTKLTISLENGYTYLNQNNIYLNNKLLLNRNDIKCELKGDHNLKNIMFVLTVASLYNLDLNKTLDSIKNFKPLEHRLEYVGKYKDIEFYNDTIATIPEATINGCIALKNVDTLIFGGMDRHIDYNEFIDYLNSSNISNFICMPTTGYKIAEYLDQDKVKKAETLEEAVDLAFKLTEKNKICLLSPAASSYEYFKNYEEKGNRFKELVRKNTD